MFFSLKKIVELEDKVQLIKDQCKSEVKLIKDQCRLDIRKYSFSHRIINEWNKLSMDCLAA